MTSMTLDRHKGHAFEYDVVLSGYNYRITEISAALGIVQLSKLNRNNKRREELAKYYRSQLSNLKDVSVPFENRWDTPRTISFQSFLKKVFPDPMSWLNLRN